MPRSDAPALLTIEEAAARMRRCKATVRRAIKSGRLKATQPNGKGSAWFTTVEACDAWLAGPPPSAEEQSAAVVASFRAPVVRDCPTPTLDRFRRKRAVPRIAGGSRDGR